MSNNPLPDPALMVGDQVRITADGYGGLRGFLASIRPVEGSDYEYLVESPYGDALIGPLARHELAPIIHCEWFLTCAREALSTVAHPILGDVPVCDSCLKFADPDPATF